MFAEGLGAEELLAVIFEEFQDLAGEGGGLSVGSEEALAASLVIQAGKGLIDAQAKGLAASVFENTKG